MKGIKSTIGLLIALLVLLGLFLYLKKHKGEGTEANFRTTIPAPDTTATAILLRPAIAGGAEVKFEKKADGWYVSDGAETMMQQEGEAENLIVSLQKLRIKSVVGIDESSWAKYQVDDSAGTFVMFNNNPEQSYWIGKFDYQMQNGGGNTQQGQNFMGISYLRYADEKATYAVEAFLPMLFNKKASDFQNRTVLKYDFNILDSITYTYANGEKYAFKYAKGWKLNNQAIDSARTVNYLSDISRVVGVEVWKNVPQLTEQPDVLTAYVNDGENIVLKAYPIYQQDTMYAIGSSMLPDRYFKSKSKSGMYEMLFLWKKRLGIE